MTEVIAEIPFSPEEHDVPVSAADVLPDHMTIGLHDEASQVVDDFTVDAHLRIVHKNETIPVDAPIGEKIEIIKTAVMPIATTAPSGELTTEQREARRAEVYARQVRRRKFGRPILRFETIQYPRPRY